jgi:radical SAM protein with 4Fe4S-binding SPASM domain
MKLPEFPRNLMLEPTNFCNAECPLCPTGIDGLRRAKGFMDDALFHKIADEASAYHPTMVLWNYGEPFMHPRIFDLIEYASSRGIRVVSSTNGYALYKEQFVERLLTCGLDTLIVCIDGATEDVNAAYRVNISLERVIEGLRMLKSQRRKMKHSQVSPRRVLIQTILMKQNEHQIGEIRKLAKELGDQYQVKSVNLTMVPNVSFEDYLPTDTRYRRYALHNNGEWGFGHRVPNTCSFIDQGFVINWDGTVNPCCWDYQGEVVIGDVTTQMVKEVWEGHHLAKLRAAIHTDRAAIPMCAVCSTDVKSPRTREFYNLETVMDVAKRAAQKLVR